MYSARPCPPLHSRPLQLAKNVQGIVLANWFEFEFKKLKDSREAQAARVSRQQHGSSSSSGGGGGRGGSAQHAGSVAPWTPLVAKAAKLAGYDQRQAAAKLLPFELDGLLHIFGCKLSRALGFDVPYRKNTPCGWSTPSTGLIGKLAPCKLQLKARGGRGGGTQQGSKHYSGSDA